MKKIIVLLPENLIGKVIMKGFARGFELNKCCVLKKNITELTSEDVEKFKPDMIFGYDYSFLADKNCTTIVKSANCKNLVFYFSDEPQSKWALGESKKMYEELKKLKSTIFIWDKDYEKDFKKCFYLPLAIDPAKYQTDFTGYKYPISFVGLPLTDARQKVLCELVKVFKNKLNIFSTEKEFLRSVEAIKEKKLLNQDDLTAYSKCWRGFIETEEDLAKVYNSSKINLNIHFQGKSSLNYSVFAILASGGFLLTDERDDLKEYFEQRHLDTYKNVNDLIDKIDFYLKNLNIAQKIARLGKFEVIENHDFSARARYVLKKIFKAAA